MLGGCIDEPIEAMLVNDDDDRSETGSRWTGFGRGRRGMCKRQGGLAVRGERKELAWEWGDAVSVRSIGNARPRFGGMYGCVVDRSEVGVRVTCAERGGLGSSGGGERAGGRAGEDVGGRVGVDSMASLKNWANHGDKAKGLLTETRLSRRCNDGGQAAQAMESGRGGGGQGRPIRDGCQEGVWLCRAMWLAELECKAARIDVGAQPTQVLQS